MISTGFSLHRIIFSNLPRYSYHLNPSYLSYLLFISDRISSRLSSHHISSHRRSSCLSSRHLIRSFLIMFHHETIYLISMYLMSSYLIVSYLVSPHHIPSIASHRVASYHTSSAIIFHISRHPASTQWKTICQICYHDAPPGQFEIGTPNFRPHLDTPFLVVQRIKGLELGWFGMSFPFAWQYIMIFISWKQPCKARKGLPQII